MGGPSPPAYRSPTCCSWKSSWSTCTPGRLVIGFFDSDDEVAAFDHKVYTAYRWPVGEFSARLAKAGFTELQRVRQQFPERPDRKYAAIAATAAATQ